MTPPTLPGTEWTGDIDGGNMPICVTTANGRVRAWWWDSGGEPQWRATGGDPIDVGPWKWWALSLRAERDAFQRGSGCVDGDTISEALANIGRLLSRTPTEGIPDAAERLARGLRRATYQITRLAVKVANLEAERDAALAELADFRAVRRGST